MNINLNFKNIFEGFLGGVILLALGSGFEILKANRENLHIPESLVVLYEFYWYKIFITLLILLYVLKTIQYRKLIYKDSFQRHFSWKEGVSWLKVQDENSFKRYLFLFWFIENKRKKSDQFTYNQISNDVAPFRFAQNDYYKLLFRKQILFHEAVDNTLETFTININPDVYAYLSKIRKDTYVKYKYYESYNDYKRKNLIGDDLRYNAWDKKHYDLAVNKVNTLRSKSFSSLLYSFLSD
ncbi:hypothetical protein EHQ81_08445 [Leptospira selangorensis]|uniref:Uncharacterized protein n=1 Tax=Leptospira selangorensis TaxID=2484982 RepID=A0A5F2C4G9_9LEPT|nr:hypothetical protein [Leptospira selangorensis]TGM14220.1 hypothetical protein EHQ81_08445 [Leptospira selangorensis]TGM20197.1 hypothetical protein EHQ82_10825 [Leptospira selangorensis]